MTWTPPLPLPDERPADRPDDDERTDVVPSLHSIDDLTDRRRVLLIALFGRDVPPVLVSDIFRVRAGTR